MDQAGEEEEGNESSRSSSSSSSTTIIISTGIGGTSSTSASTNSVVSSSYPPRSSSSCSSTSPSSSAARCGIGGSRQQCALPDHRVQAGCTSVVALLVNNELLVANAGDSRAVLCRGGTAIALSEDHKPLQDRELDRIRRAGGFVTEQGRVNGNLNLSRSIGDLKYKGWEGGREGGRGGWGGLGYLCLCVSWIVAFTRRVCIEHSLPLLPFPLHPPSLHPSHQATWPCPPTTK